ncbi:MAG: DNA polymerase III subunit delta' [Steroidobacteraceae bacterium]|jgi:DNA polymerase-3 subunit delta'
MMPADCFWLVPAMEALRKAHQAGRLGQALLIHADPGCGGELLAEWATQLVLCRQDSAPCGECIDCRRCAAAQHPDLFAVQPTGESKQIRVTEVRDFCAELSLTSHGGGYRAGVIAPADSLNVAAANSLLKTLEEPPPRTLIVLVTATPSRLPATVRSRCMRLRVTAPGRTATFAWLADHGRTGDLAAAADILGDAPLALLAADLAEIGRVRAESVRALEEIERGRADPSQLAERWSREDYALRLACIEAWLGARIRLSARLSNGNIARQFGLLDAVRELRREIDTPLNKSVALERWLWRLAGAETERRLRHG